MTLYFEPSSKHTKGNKHKPLDVFAEYIGDEWFIGRIVWDSEIEEYVFSPKPKVLYSSEELHEISKFLERQREISNDY